MIYIGASPNLAQTLKYERLEVFQRVKATPNLKINLKLGKS